MHAGRYAHDTQTLRHAYNTLLARLRKISTAVMELACTAYLLQQGRNVAKKNSYKIIEQIVRVTKYATKNQAA